MIVKNNHIKYLLFFTLSFVSCKKMMEISPPVDTITSSQVFSTDGQALSAVSSLYFRLINTSFSFSNGGMTIFSGMSADELKAFNQTNTLYVQFQNNQLQQDNIYVSNNFWGNAYSLIYTSNAILEGLQSYSGVHDSVKKELTGEAKFIRAFCNFYLVNLFGDVPLVTTINWHNTSLLGRTSKTDVYNSIIADLQDAQNLLANDYSAGEGERIIPNKWAATALLARVYLYLKNWPDAETQSSALISNASLYKLTDSLNSVFLTNSTEAIWQLKQSNNGTASYNATYEGYQLVPRNATTQPSFYITPQLLNSFEPGDQRKVAWLNSVTYLGIQYFYPYKYKKGVSQAVLNGPYTEYYMALRLAEQYLIRAEAKAQENTDLIGAISDLNTIRYRAGLPALSTSLTQTQILSAVEQERKIELFSEWGHRWLDLKRTDQATTTLELIKTQWTPSAQLYPIPISELTTDPNLVQNTGY